MQTLIRKKEEKEKEEWEDWKKGERKERDRRKIQKKRREYENISLKIVLPWTLFFISTMIVIFILKILQKIIFCLELS